MSSCHEYAKMKEYKDIVSGFTLATGDETKQARCEYLAEKYSHNLENIIVAKEKHTDVVRIITERDLTEEARNERDNSSGFDAMVTATPDIVLCIFTADCVPIIMYDKKTNVIGIAHSGWAGASKGIAGNTVKVMMSEYGCDPRDIVCELGPYNHVCCYEVGEDVRDKFLEHFSQEECGQMFRAGKALDKYYLDLGSAVRCALTNEGIPAENIYDMGCCTCHNEEFPSWRRTHDASNQILSYISLKSVQ